MAELHFDMLKFFQEIFRSGVIFIQESLFPFERPKSSQERAMDEPDTRI